MGKKTVAAAFLLLACVCSASALDLTLTDGTELKNIVIVHIGHYGVLIHEYPFGTGSYLITRTIPWRKLTPHSRAMIRQQFPVSRPQIAPGTRIRFDSVTMTANGSIGWAVRSSWTMPAAPERYGLICIRGLFLPQGGTWFGRVYPSEGEAFYLGIPVPVFTSGSYH